MEKIGLKIISIGIFIIVAGVIIYFFGNKLRFLGKLPGDIQIKTDNVQIYFPVVTMLLVSILLSFFMWLFNKFK